MDPLPSQPVADLGWSQVGFALTFIAFNSIISQVLQLGVGASILFAALRCVVQLTLMATILQHVFAAENFWAVVGIACKYVVVCLADLDFKV
jgi:ABC-type iron transport system FetAB permease component